MRLEKSLLIFLSFVFVRQNLNADIRGSETLVSIESTFNFPTNPVQANRMLAFGYFKNGFSLQDSTTTCSFESAFPVSGNIDLRGGQLYLTNDLCFDNGSSLVSSGQFLSQGRDIQLAQTMTQIPANQITTLKNTHLFLSNDLTLSGTIKFKGNCILNGRGKLLTLASSACMVIAPGASLHIQDVSIDNLRRNNIYCMTNEGSLILNDAHLIQSGKFTFSNGSISVRKDVVISGQHTFVYQSKLTSTIEQNASLTFDQGLTFSYDPRNNSDQLLFLQDKSSHLALSNATIYATRSGFKLLRGSLDVQGNAQLYAEPGATIDVGIILGNDNSSQDCHINFADGALLTHFVGSFVYRNVDLASILAKNVLSTIRLESGTRLNLKQSINLDNGRLQLSSNASIDSVPGAQINGTVEIF